MFEKYNSSGYNLYQPFPDLNQWVFDDRSNPFHGTLKEVVTYMVQKLEFRLDDIEDGLMLLADNVEHNNIHFGCFRTCIFTSKKEINYERSA